MKQVQFCVVSGAQERLLDLFLNRIRISSMIDVLEFRITVDAGSPRTIESAASFVSDQILVRSAEAELLILGFETSCFLTYEVANQLFAHGLRINGVVLVNPFNSSKAETRLLRDDHALNDFEQLMAANREYRPFTTSVPVECFVTQRDAAKTTENEWGGFSSANYLITTRHFAPRLDESGFLDELAQYLNSRFPRQISAMGRHLSSVELNRGSASTCVFVFPGAGDTAVSLLPLLGALPSSWRVFGLHPRGFDEASTPFPTAEAAAQSFVDEILSLPPRGVLHFLGHSLGGLLALIVAKKLASRGLLVRSIMIVDSDVPHNPPKWEYTDREVLGEYLALLEQAAGRQLTVTADDLAAMGTPKMIAALHAAMVSAELVSSRSSPSSFLGAYRLFAASIRWKISQEDVKGFDGDCAVTLAHDNHSIRSKKAGRPDARAAQWRKLLPRAAVTTVSGNHISILKPPHCNQVVDAWRELIEAQGDSGGLSVTHA